MGLAVKLSLLGLSLFLSISSSFKNRFAMSNVVLSTPISIFNQNSFLNRLKAILMAKISQYFHYSMDVKPINTSIGLAFFLLFFPNFLIKKLKNKSNNLLFSFCK